MKHVHSRLSFAVILTRSIAGFAVFCASTASADNTWDGGGGGTYVWSDNVNWGGDTAPGYGTLIFSGGIGNTNIMDANYSMNQIQWNGSGAWILNNSNSGVLSLFDNSGTQAKLESLGAGGVTINAPIAFAATAGAAWGEINSVSSSITFGSTGTLSLTGSQVAGIRLFGGSGATSTTFNNTVNASGKYFSTSAVGQTVNLGGSFTASNFYLMNAGTLNLNTGGNLNSTSVRLGGDFATTGTQNLGLGATFNLTPLPGGLTFAGVVNSVANNTSGALVVNSQNSSGTNILSNQVALDSALQITQAAGGTLNITQAKGGDNTTGTDIKGNTLTFTPAASGAINHSGTIYNSTCNGNVTMNGAGTLTLSGANTYTGLTIISTGTLKAGSATALGSSAAGTTIQSGGTLDLNGQNLGAEGVTVSGTGVGGNGAIVNSGASQVQALRFLTLAADATLSANNRWDLRANGTATLDMGGHTLTTAGSDQLSLVGVSVSNPGFINVTSGTFSIEGGTNLGGSAANTITVQSAGTLQAYDNSTVAWTIVSNGGTIKDAHGSAAWNAPINLASGTTTIDLSGGSLGFNGIFSGSGSLNKIGGNTLGINGSSTYTGVTTITVGTLNVTHLANVNIASSLGKGSAAGSAADLVFNGGTLQYNQNFGAAKSTDRLFTLGTGGGTIDSSADSHVTQPATLSFTGTGAIAFTGSGARTLTLAGSSAGANLFAPLLGDGTGGATSLVKSGQTTWVLTGNNSYSGGTTISLGTLQVGNGGTTGTLGSGPVNVNASRSLIFNRSDVFPVANQITGAGFVTQTGAGTVVFSGANTYTGVTTISAGILSVGTIGNGGIASGNLGSATNVAVNLVFNGGTLQYTGLTASTNRNFTINAGKTATFDVTANNLTVSGASTATTGALTKIGAGTLTLSGANTYTGATTLGAGILSVGTIGNGGIASGNLGSATNAAVNLIFDGGTLQYTGSTASTDRNFTINIGKTAIFEITANNLTVSGASTATTGALTKIGAGTLTLSGASANLYSGVTTVTNGGLDLSKTAGVDAISGDITVNGGTVKLLAFNQIKDTSSVTLSSGAFSLNGQTETVISFSNSGGTFSTGAGHLTGTGATVTWSGGTNTINNGGLVEDGHIVITGGLNTVQGGATGGVLQLNAGGTGLEMTGATLALDSGSALAGRLILSGNVTVHISANPSSITSNGTLSQPGTVDLNGGSRTFTVEDGASASDLAIGAIVTNGAVTKTGAGTMTLSGVDTYSGATTISGGTLEVGGSGALTATTRVTVNSGGTALLSGTNTKLNTVAPMTLAGGKLDLSGMTSSLDQTVGALTLSTSSIIDFGMLAAGNTLRFADSSSVVWSGLTLNIWNWTSGIDHLFFGNGSGTGLQSSQLDKIKFFSDNGTTILPYAPGFSGFTGGFGEVVPVPEPSAVFTGLALLGLVGFRERQRLRDRPGR